MTVLLILLYLAIGLRLTRFLHRGRDAEYVMRGDLLYDTPSLAVVVGWPFFAFFMALGGLGLGVAWINLQVERFTR